MKVDYQVDKYRRKINTLHDCCTSVLFSLRYLFTCTWFASFQWLAHYQYYGFQGNKETFKFTFKEKFKFGIALIFF